MAYVKGNRDDVVRTTTGHVIAFEAGEIKRVPDDVKLLKACAERGHIQVPKPEPVVEAKPPVFEVSDPDPEPEHKAAPSRRPRVSKDS